MKGKDSAADLLNKCMYTVGMGSNDYINNYLSNSYNTSHMYTPEQYATALIQQYSQQLKELYGYGARKIALLGIGPLGCTPGNVALHGTNGSLCVDFINDAVELFNSKLISLVDELNKDLHDAKFIYVNIYGIALIPTKAELLGFDNSIPSFARARGDEILKGVNYASGAAGIRDESGAHLVI
ncbi:hypothetical protein LWI29_035644 [Acer saccharum]|uniref:GDSL esterase/lipase n=1 Tax=Acer saccharum TaxID=4024 RepID=A0AA39VUI9_ACESA|nr:hypothetical protein LWI29_035644 [Acer saccharum]